jgi:hypothetical protein
LATGVAAIHPGLTDEAAKGNYARLLSILPPGVVGLLMVGELAVIIGGVASLTNWGASVVTNDVYRLHLVKRASEKHYVHMGMLFGCLMLLAGGLVGSLLVDEFFSWFVFINTATMTFLLPIGFLRYFWWRFNIWGEIVGIAAGVPFCILVWFVLGGSQWPFWQVFLTLFGSGAVAITLTALLTKPTDNQVLQSFYKKCQPPGFWGPVRNQCTTPCDATNSSSLRKDEASHPERSGDFGHPERSEGSQDGQILRCAQNDARPMAFSATGTNSSVVDRKAFFEFALTLAALACMFFAINSFLGHRLGLALGAASAFLVLGGLVVAMSVRSLAEESDAAVDTKAEETAAWADLDPLKKLMGNPILQAEETQI